MKNKSLKCQVNDRIYCVKKNIVLHDNYDNKDH